MENDYSLFDLINSWEQDLEKQESFVFTETKPSNRTLNNILSVLYNPSKIYSTSLKANIDLFLN